MEASLEEIKRKYRSAKAENTKIGLLNLKSEIESYIKTQQSSRQKNDDLVADARDMLMDITQMIEEGHCNPFRSRKL